MKFLPDVVRYLSSVSPLLGFGLLVWNVKRIKHEKYTMFLLFFILLAASITDIASFFIKDVSINYSIVNFFFPFAFILIAKIYFHVLSDERGVWAFDAIGLLIITFIAGLYFGQPIDLMQNYFWTVCCFCGLVLSFMHLYEFRKNQPIYSSRHPLWWFSTGVFYYCFTNIGLIAVSNELMERFPQYFNHIWMFHNFNNIIKNVCFAIAVYWAVHRNPNWDEGYRPK